MFAHAQLRPLPVFPASLISPWRRSDFTRLARDAAKLHWCSHLPRACEPSLASLGHRRRPDFTRRRLARTGSRPGFSRLAGLARLVTRTSLASARPHSPPSDFTRSDFTRLARDAAKLHWCSHLPRACEPSLASLGHRRRPDFTRRRLARTGSRPGFSRLAGLARLVTRTSLASARPHSPP